MVEKIVNIGFVAEESSNYLLHFLQCFWSLVNTTLKNIFEQPSGSESVSGFETVPCKDPLSFSWWVVSHLAPLYQFDRNGNLDEKVGMLFSKYLRVIIIVFHLCGYFD